MKRTDSTRKPETLTQLMLMSMLPTKQSAPVAGGQEEAPKSEPSWFQHRPIQPTIKSAIQTISNKSGVAPAEPGK
jgi:hypothetical protein